jgi:hypothetical protein
MSTVEVPVDDEIMDFSSPRQTIKFKVDGDVFEASPQVAAISMIRFATEAELLEKSDTRSDEQIKIIENLFRIVLTRDSAERFIARLSDDDRPIGVSQFVDITKWLLERYGLRPTEPDSES